MSDANLTAIIERIKRYLSQTVVSGTYTDTDLEYYAQDTLPIIESDYADFGTYTISIGVGISPSPTSIDSTLISLKAASAAYIAVAQASIADSILVKAGAITLDTSKSLRARGIEVDRFEDMYQKVVDQLTINGGATPGAGVGGYNIDSYKEYENQEADPDSLH